MKRNLKRNPANFTARDRALLDTLALRVRVLSVRQIARHWFAATSDPLRNARRHAQALAAGGFVELFSMPARPEITLVEAAVTWRPGDAPPDFARLSHQLTSRWNEPAAPTELVIATPRGGGWLGGGGGRRPRRSEVSHDIALTGLYLRWAVQCRQTGDEWVSEARLRKMGFGEHARLPDAMVRNGDRWTAIELGGAYSADKLADFHRFCAARTIAYELW